MKKNGSMYFFYVVIGITIVAMAVITLAMKSESTSFPGIADAKEIVVNVQSAIEIKKIRVMPGQIVKIGDTLVEYNDVFSQSEVRQERLELDDRKSEILGELQELQSQYKVNQSLVSDLKSINKEYSDVKKTSMKSNPVLLKIDFLKKELRRIEGSSKNSLRPLNNKLALSGNTIDEQVKQREAELKVMQGERLNFYILATIDGIIGGVKFRDGEKVNDFDTIVTLHTLSPTIIRGYIHENSYSQIGVGQKVIVTSQDVKKYKISGEVIGVGSRIVEYPMRLKKYVDLQMWGREVAIKISEENKLLLGEKVMISIEHSNASLFNFKR